MMGKLTYYIKEPRLNLRIVNFKVTVHGEVNKPGVFTISSERITLLEAIAQAGDLTIYGKRDNILVIREQNGTKTYARVDLTKADFFQSPYYYLTQNDVVYVEPNKTKINASAVGPNLTVIFTGISLLITIVALTIR
jgi:polysaccharide export outer membrane protein